MKELVIKKEYINSNLTPGEIMLLVMVYDQNKLLFKHFLSIYEGYTHTALESLQKKLFIKINGEEFENLIIREKGLKLFESNTNQKNIKFEVFWTSYHDITKLPKTDKKPAMTKWKRLTDSNKQKAIDNIQNYFSNLNDEKYCKKARTYLEDENFNDDYGSSISNETRITAM